VFLSDGTVLYCTWDADKGSAGARHRFYKIFRVMDFQVKRDTIEVTALVWYAERVMQRDSLPVTDGHLGELPGLWEGAERCRRELTICRTLENEEQLLAALESRKTEAAQFS